MKPIVCFLSAVAATIIAAPVGVADEVRASVNESDTGARLFDDIKGALAAGRFEEAARDLRDFRARVDTSAVFPETHQGLRLAMRNLVYSLKANQRAEYERLVGQEVQEAWREAGGATAARRRVVLDYPGTEIVRQTCLQLAATSLEAGDFVQAVAWLRQILDDPCTSSAVRLKAALLLVQALVMQGRPQEAAVAVDQALKGIEDQPTDYWGTRCTAREAAQRMLEASAKPGLAWPQVGGTVARTGLCSGEVQAGECISLGTPSVVGGFDVDRDQGFKRYELLNSPLYSTSGTCAERAAVASSQCVVVAEQDGLCVYDRRTWQFLWRQAVVPSGLEGLIGLWPACDENTLVLLEPRLCSGTLQSRAAYQHGVGYYWRNIRHVLIARDLKTGRMLWQWEGRPLADRVKSTSGHQEDRNEHATAPDSSDVKMEEGFEPTGTPLIYCGRIYVPAVRTWFSEPPEPRPVESCIVCLNAADGRVLWSLYVASGSHIDRPRQGASLSPDQLVTATDGHLLYVTAGLGTVAALDLATGEVAWVTTLPLAKTPAARGVRECLASLVVGSDRIVLNGWRMDKTVRALAKNDGRVLWEQTLPVQGLPIVQGICEGHVVVTGDDHAWSYSFQDGKLLWETRLPGPVTGRGFLLADGAAMVPTALGLVRLDAKGAAVVVQAVKPDENPPGHIMPLDGTIIATRRTDVVVCAPLDVLMSRYENLHHNSPQSLAPLMALADLHLRRGRPADAEAVLAEACRIQIPSEDANLARGERVRAAISLCELRRTASDDDVRVESQTLLEEAVKRAAGLPIEAVGMIALAKEYESRGDRARAAETYRRAALVPSAAVMMEHGDPAVEPRKSLAAWAESRATQLRPEAAVVFRRPRTDEDVARLQVFDLGQTAWEPDYYSQDDERPLVLPGPGAVPVVWLGRCSIAALGPRGQVLWRRTWSTTDGHCLGGTRTETLATLATPFSLRAYKIADGQAAWQWRPEAGQTIVWHQAVNADQALTKNVGSPGLVLVLTEHGDSPDHRRAVALDSSSGRLVWQSDVPRGISAGVAQLGNTLFLGGSGPNNSGCHYVLAFDAASGNRLWEDTGEEGLRGYPRLLLGKDCVLLTDSFVTRAYDLATGVSLWKRKIPEHGRDASILANNDQTVVMYNDKGFVALDTRTGNDRWRVPAQNLKLQFSGGRPAILTDTMMFAWTGRQVVGHTLTDGRSAWQCAYDQSIPVLAADDHMIAAVDSQGGTTVRFLEIGQGRLLGQKQLVSQAARLRAISDPTREIVATSFGWYVRMGHEHLLLAVADEAEPGDH